MRSFAIRLRNYLFASTTIFLMMHFATAYGQAQIQITDCTDIRNPGQYVLVRDLQNCGIAITTGNVELSLNGHRISDALHGIYILARSGNVRVHGPGTLTNDTAGVTISRNQPPGLIEIEDVSVERCTTGFSISYSMNVHLNNDSATGCDTGFLLVFSDSNFLIANTSNENRRSCFYIEWGDANVLNGNVALHNGQYGIFAMRDSEHNFITNNTAGFNHDYDLFEGNPTCDNRWLANDFGTANLGCIH